MAIRQCRRSRGTRAVVAASLLLLATGASVTAQGTSQQGVVSVLRGGPLNKSSKTGGGINQQCTLRQIEDFHDDDNPENDPVDPIWVCEFSGRNSTMSRGFRGSSPAYEVVGLTGAEVNSNRIISGVSTLEFSDQDAQIEEKDKLVIKDFSKTRIGLTSFAWGDRRMQEQGQDLDLSEVQHRRRLVERCKSGKCIGVKRVLAVHVTADNGEGAGPGYTPKEISDKVFGTDGDTFTLRSQYLACSHGQFDVQPATGAGIVDGVMEITIPNVVVDEHRIDIANEVRSAVAAMVGNIEENFDHVLFCLPPGSASSYRPDGTSRGWLAFTYAGYGHFSFYNGETCGHPSVAIHEVGHNLNLKHSGDVNNGAFRSYTDRSGYLGSSAKKDDGPSKCFNPQKSWQLGWYDQQSVEFSKSDRSWYGKMVGVVDYNPSNQQGKTVVLKINDAVANYYVGFNRATGFNSETQGGNDQVTIVRDGDGLTFDELRYSTMVAQLSAGESYEILLSDGSSLFFMVGNIVTSDNSPWYAEVQISSSEQDLVPDFDEAPAPAPAPTANPTNRPTSRPTANPTNRPTSRPTPPPVASPTNRPTPRPTNRPTSKPTSRPTLQPTRNPTPSPTRNSNPQSDSPITNAVDCGNNRQANTCSACPARSGCGGDCYWKGNKCLVAPAIQDVMLYEATGTDDEPLGPIYDGSKISHSIVGSRLSIQVDMPDGGFKKVVFTWTDDSGKSHKQEEKVWPYSMGGNTRSLDNQAVAYLSYSGEKMVQVDVISHGNKVVHTKVLTFTLT